LAALFASQLLFTSPIVRYGYSIAYVVLTILLLATNRESRHGFFDFRRLRPGARAAEARRQA
jgi:hypothetical protein